MPPSNLSKPINLQRQSTFDDVVSRLQQAKDPETPVANKKKTKKHSRRASITDFTFLSEHSLLVDPDDDPVVKNEEPTKTSNNNNNAKKDREISNSRELIMDSPMSPTVVHSPTTNKKWEQEDEDDAMWEADESDSPVPPVSRSKLEQAKRKSSRFLSKVIAARGSAVSSIISSPRATRRFKKKMARGSA